MENENTLSFYTTSDALDSSEEVFAETGYTDISGIQSLMTFNIFTVGVLAGIMLGVIFWKKL